MPQGQSIGETFYMLRDNPYVVPPLSFTDEISASCCFALPALAEIGDKTNDLFNDYHCPLFFWGNGFQTANLKLQKNINGEWTDILTLTDNGYGEYHEFGFFVDRYLNSAIGYTLDWNLVLNSGADNFGEGNYRIKSTGTPTFGIETVEKFSFEFCLKKYTEARADKTVRISWYNNGTKGDPEDDRKKKDFGTLNWFNQIRLPNASFGSDTSDFTEEFVKYQTGFMDWTEDSQTEKYKMELKGYPNEIHRYVKIDILQSDNIIISDYNTRNPTPHTNKEVRRIGNYEPNYVEGALKSSVEISFQQAFQNLIKKRS